MDRERPDAAPGDPIDAGTGAPAGSLRDRIAARLRSGRAASLRTRLLTVTLALVTVGLVIAGAVTYSSLRSFLLDRVDDQLRDAQAPVVFELERTLDGRFHRPRRRPGPAELPRGTVAAFYDSAGTQIATLTEGTKLPGPVPDGYSTRALDGAGDYRILSATEIDVDGDGRGEPVAGRLVVGIPLGDVNDTLGRLLVIELLVGAAVLAAIAGAGLWLVRLGLRPLEDIQTTAGAIAAGDLSRRIDDANTETEVGRLAGSLNVMLGKIEESFAEREQSERRLRQFVADASHELQTPLTSVRGYAELFRRGAAERPEDLANAMRRIEAEAERMGVLVDDLLLLARLDQGRPLERQPVDLAEIARELVGDARVVDPGRPIELELDGPLVVEGDGARLRQVIANLLSNARTHTPAGTPVTVRGRRVGGEAMVEVADRGPGMAPQHAARVFERFFRADPSRARASGGTGLGLSIVAAIIEAHHGRVEVETSPGAGATFRVRLPLDGPDAEGETAEIPAEPAR